MNLILLEPAEVVPGGTCRLRGRRADHIRTVLRAAAGDELRVGVVEGPRGRARVAAIGEDAVDLEVELEVEIPPRPCVDLILAVPRPKVLKRLWAPLASLGVDRILLIRAWKVEKTYFGTHVLDPAFYRPLLLEGLEQAQDTRLPEVRVFPEFRPFAEDALDALLPPGLRLLADPGDHPSLYDTIRAAAPARVALAVGPEGGWTDYEREQFLARGFRPVSLGPRALRTDVACVALLAMVHEARRPAPRSP